MAHRPTPARGHAAAGRAEQAELIFESLGGKEHGAQRSVPRPENEVFALWSRTRTRQCPVAVTGNRGFNRPPIFGSASPDFSHAPGLDTGAGLGVPERLRVLPAPEVPGTMSKPKGTPQKYQGGPSSWATTASGEGGDSNWSRLAGVGIIGAWFAAGIRIYSQSLACHRTPEAFRQRPIE